MSVLEVHALTKRYGRVHALRGVDLTVERGQVYGLLGPNGSGKTTTMQCALGLLAPTSGEVRILGVPAARIHRTLGRVASMFDDATLVGGLNVRQNLQYQARLLGHRGGRSVDDVLELVGIAHLAKQRAGALSLGQSRRVAIARTLLGAPELVVLDEPLSGLDTVGVIEVLALIERLSMEGLTLIVSSHRMHEVERVVSHVGVLLDGELVREGTLESLLASRAGRVQVHVAPERRALEVLGGLDGVDRVEVTRAARNGSPAHLVVSAGDVAPSAINRVLVEAGCDVSTVAPERADLHGVFEAILEETASRKEGAA